MTLREKIISLLTTPLLRIFDITLGKFYATPMAVRMGCLAN